MDNKLSRVVDENEGEAIIYRMVHNQFSRSAVQLFDNGKCIAQPESSFV